eukprot:c5362_g1_i1 orf=69-629(+)
MMLRSPQSLVECNISSLGKGSQPHHSAKKFVIGKGLEKEKQKQKQKARQLRPRASTPLQQEREPRNGSQGAQQSAQSQLELLEKLTMGREKAKSGSDKSTIAEQIASKVVANTDEEVVIPLGKQIPLEYDDLTVSQKRNIRRQKYLDQVSKRNDAPFFTAIALFVILPPAVILGVAVATGYIDLLP